MLSYLACTAYLVGYVGMSSTVSAYKLFCSFLIMVGKDKITKKDELNAVTNSRQNRLDHGKSSQDLGRVTIFDP